MTLSVTIDNQLYQPTSIISVDVQRGFAGFDDEVEILLIGQLTASALATPLVVSDGLMVATVEEVLPNPFEQTTLIRGRALPYPGDAIVALQTAVSRDVAPLVAVGGSPFRRISSIVADTVIGADGRDIRRGLTEHINVRLTEQTDIDGCLAVLARYLLTAVITADGVNVYPIFDTDNTVTLQPSDIFVRLDIDVDRQIVDDNDGTAFGEKLTNEYLKRQVAYNIAQRPTLGSYPKQAINPRYKEPSPEINMKEAVLTSLSLAYTGQLNARIIDFATPFNTDIRPRTLLQTGNIFGYDRWQTLSVNHIIGNGQRDTVVRARNVIEPAVQ